MNLSWFPSVVIEKIETVVRKILITVFLFHRSRSANAKT